MADDELLSFAHSAHTVSLRVAGVADLLAEGSRCVLQRSKDGARRDALKTAEHARDMLDDLIRALRGDA